MQVSRQATKPFNTLKGSNYYFSMLFRHECPGGLCREAVKAKAINANWLQRYKISFKKS